ncbi:protein YqbG [Bacillus sp. NPDC094077]|uniref:protein YqbG n=1 Tax=Bacillus sp. NPDC094077 TaxID=3390932 RepID=UPI003D023442
MPLITPGQLIDYTTFDEVKVRDPKLLQMDIVEAQNEIFSLTFVDFEDKEKFPSVPDVVEIACFKFAQYYALVNSDETTYENVQSERMGNYSYQSGGYIKPDVRSLLSQWISEKKQKGTVKMRLRSI